MKETGKKIVKLRIPILILSILLLIPSIFGYVNTRINYDIMYYLPDDIDTMVGQNILLEDFNKGAYATVVVDKMDVHSLTKLENKIKEVEHVEKVVSFNSLAGTTIPTELIPDQYRELFINKESGATLFAIFFDDTTSSNATMEAIQEIRTKTDHQCFISGMSAVVTDTKALSEKEAPLYVCIAVILVCIILAIFMDSFLVPVFFMISIGMSIIYNLGSNYFLGEVSYVTKALAAVLQLGVTLDYSIFLWHSYKEAKNESSDKNTAMAMAINSTLTSVIGSSITTVAGFIALCFMSFTLGLDLGIVMAKGVVLGVIGCVTILPALILTFDHALDKTTHKVIMPNFHKLASYIVKHAKIFALIFAILIGPAYYGQKHTNVYYDLASTLPAKLDCSIANKKLEDNFNMKSIYMILADSKLSPKVSNQMIEEIKQQDGVILAMSLDSILGPSIPDEIIPQAIKDTFKGKDYSIMLVASDYKIASEKVNKQITNITAITKKYDSKSMVIGEAPCTKDLIRITDHDFKVVSAISIIAIFMIIAFVLKSASLPIILVTTIEFAIFVNMGIPYFTHTSIPFIASVVIGTIQLGATVDYAILITTRYKKERSIGLCKEDAITTALETSIPSIIVSALGFFMATAGVGAIASVDMIGSLCTLMARGAIISMIVVIVVLPSLFMLFDKLIIKTTIGFNTKKGNESYEK